MEFSVFSDLVPKIKKLDLPGQQAHLDMAPERRIRELERLKKAALSARQAGVLALCYPGADARTYLILILRPSYPGVHSNQIAFPGGRREQTDADLWATAKRETEEEVGVPSAAVREVRALTPLYIPPSNYMVSPYLGLLSGTPRFQKQESEVAGLIQVPLEDLLDDSFRVSSPMDTSYGREVEVPAFHFGGQVVWGATAMMLNELKWLIRASL